VGGDHNQYLDLETRVGAADTHVHNRLGEDERTPMPSSAVGLHTGTTVGRFEVGPIIGRGGMGSVYAAVDADGTKAAIKVLHKAHDSAAVARFRREATIRIDHPNVVQVLDTGKTTADGSPYIAFELLEGQSLETRIAREAPLPPSEVVDIALQATAGLEAAHAIGIVHRDLKPANMFCCADGTLKILDFGIAHLGEDHPRLTRAGMVVGTPCYLAPEQARGEADLDARADVWALGAVMYEALCGRPPFLRESSLATMIATIMENLTPLAARIDGLPQDLCAVVEKALIKEPWRRWPDIVALRVAIEAIDFTRAAPARPASELASIAAGEQRVVAVLLANDVRDMSALGSAIREKGGELIPLLGNHAIGLFGAESWEGDEVQRAVLAGLVARGSASSMSVASGRAAATGNGIAGAVLDAAEAGVAAGLHGLALNLSAARALGDDYEIKSVTAACYEALGHMPGRVMRTSGSGTLSAPQIVVGRDAELAQLERAIETMVDEARPVVVSIVGPTGIGKSHLRGELERLLQPTSRQVAPIPVMVGHAEPHQRGRAFSTLQSALTNRALILAVESDGPFLDPTAPDADQREAVRRLVAEAVEPGEVERCAEYVGALFGLATTGLEAARADPQVLQDNLRMALSDYFIGLFDKGPWALVFEDIQWADEASLALLGDLVEQLEDEPALFVTTAREDRPELHDQFVGAHTVRIEPRPLNKGEVDQLAQSIARRPLSDSVVAMLSERTGGNPLFVEQIVRALVDEGDGDGAEVRALPLPLTVEAAVQSRLDHLPAFEKTLVRRASVFGRPFSATEVAALGVVEAEPLLKSLRRRDILASRGRVRQGRERTYRFRNQLVSEVAYRMIAPDLLRQLHLQSGEHLARTSYAGAEEIAEHFELGSEGVRAAVYYSTAALEHAAKADGEAVVRCADKARQLGAPADTQFALNMASSDALEYLGRLDEQEAALARALKFAATDAERSRALTEHAWCLHRTGRTTEGLAVADHALAGARAVEDDEVLARALGRRAVMMVHAGDLDAAAGALGELDVIEDRLSAHLRALVAGWRGQLATARGDLGARKQAFEEAITRYRVAGFVRRIAGAETNLADVFNRVGAYDDAVAALDEAVEACRRVQNRRMEGYALANLGYAQGMLGELDKARAALAQAQTIADGAGEARLGAYVRYYGARAELHAGRYVAAASAARSVAEHARSLKLPGVAASATAVAAMAALAAGDVAAGVMLSSDAMVILEEIGSIEEDEAELFLARARAADAAGDSATASAFAARGLQRVAAVSERIGDPELRERFLRNVAAHRELERLSTAGRSR